MKNVTQKKISGLWIPGDSEPETTADAVSKAINHISRPVSILNMDGKTGCSTDGMAIYGTSFPSDFKGIPLAAHAGPILPEDLGDPDFKKTHNLRYAYVAGAMAGGITSVEMVKRIGKAGMIGFFGAGGLAIDKVELAIDTLKNDPDEFPFGFNLIHSPGDPDLEFKVVNLYIEKKVHLVSAAAYMRLTLPLVYYRVKGIFKDRDGSIITPNKIVAKVSRVEVARQFFSPPPEKLLEKLMGMGLITNEEALLARQIPMAQDLSAEADSGGHTDNRPALALLPAMLSIRDEYNNKYNYEQSLRVGLGGGIATPASAFAAFAMGAAYILTGSINQSCVEAGTSEDVKNMLCTAEQADVTMAPSADMFEMGVKVQVLKRGTMFPQRASKLYEIYRNYDSFEDLPETLQQMVEDKILKCSYKNAWLSTKAFFDVRDPKQVERALNNPKHKMALVFRSYLGQASNWATCGDENRKIDYQIWCGPAIGAFNQWVKGSFLSTPENRKVVTVAMNILTGACIFARANILRLQGATLPPDAGVFFPLELDIIKEKISS